MGKNGDEKGTKKEGILKFSSQEKKNRKNNK